MSCSITTEAVVPNKVYSTLATTTRLYTVNFIKCYFWFLTDMTETALTATNYQPFAKRREQLYNVRISEQGITILTIKNTISVGSMCVIIILYLRASIN